MREEQEQRDVLPAADDLAAAKVYSWRRISPEPSMLPSGKLAMEVSGDGRFRAQRRWADRARWSLEDRLGDVLAAAEAQARVKEERRRAAEDARQQRRDAWEKAMDAARSRFQHQCRTNALVEQVESWELANKIRDFCRAAEATGSASADWLAWARSHADDVDPTTREIAGPAEAEPKPEDLRPYLGRWSPYGPDKR